MRSLFSLQNTKILAREAFRFDASRFWKMNKKVASCRKFSENSRQISSAVVYVSGLTRSMYSKSCFAIQTTELHFKPGFLYFPGDIYRHIDQR